MENYRASFFFTSRIDNQMNLELIFFILGLLVGAGLVWLYFNKKQKDSIEIQSILSPLETKLNDFTSAFNTAYQNEADQRSSLKGEITTLNNLNKELSEEARELASALKGDNKIQGNWGEQVLENILERSGLRKNIDYTREEVLEIDSIDGDGRADVIVKIPDGGSIVIDSKLSLKSYLNYTNADKVNNKEIHLEELIKSTKTHIKTLSAKNYWSAKKIKTPDFTLMFLPLDNLFQVIVDNDKEIYDLAFEKRIIFVGPSTLMAALKTISVLWKEVGLSKNTEQIAEESGKLYDKFALFVEDLIEVQKRLKIAGEKNAEALKKLYSGPGNIIGKIEKIKELGAKTTKQVDDKSIEEVLLNDQT